jgi:hypothetical protein
MKFIIDELDDDSEYYLSLNFSIIIYFHSDLASIRIMTRSQTRSLLQDVEVITTGRRDPPGNKPKQ